VSRTLPCDVLFVGLANGGRNISPSLKRLCLKRNIENLSAIREKAAISLGNGATSGLSATRLDLRSAAVNEQFDTRDETGVIRSQKQRHLGNFLGFSHAPHRDGGHNPRDQVCR
jgi:hypothetical protein